MGLSTASNCRVQATIINTFDSHALHGIISLCTDPTYTIQLSRTDSAFLVYAYDLVYTAWKIRASNNNLCRCDITGRRAWALLVN